MIFYKKQLLIAFLFFVTMGCGVLNAQELRDEIRDERDDLMEETQAKIFSLASQYVLEDLVLISCQTFTFMLTYGELANIEVPSWENFKQYLVNETLPTNNRRGVELESTWDREMIRDVMQTVETIEAVSGYGLELVINNVDVKVYIAPELNGGDTGGDRSGGLVSYLGGQGADGRSIMGLYGEAATEPHGEYVSQRDEDTLRAIDILTNIFNEFNAQQIEQYLEYYHTVRELVGGNSPGGVPGLSDGVGEGELDNLENADLMELATEMNAVLQQGGMTMEQTEAYIASMIERYRGIMEGLGLENEERETENDGNNGGR